MQLVIISFLFAFSSISVYPEKLSAYECGFDPFDDARSRFVNETIPRSNGQVYS